MRKFSFVVCGIAAGLVALTGCATTTSGVAAPTVTTVNQLAELMSSKTSAARTAHMNLDVQAAGQDITATGQVEFAGADSKIEMSMRIPSLGAMSMDLIGSTMYMKLPAGVLPTDKPWVKFDPNGTDPVSKALSAIVSQEQQNVDPTKVLSQIAPASTITKSGKDTIDGQSTTRYAISVDTAKLLKSNLISPQLRQALTTSKAKLPPHMNYVMWINSSSLPVRFTLTETISGQQVNLEMNYTDWGQPVSIQAPPADQVGPLPTH
ncbi:MAG TPA: hypothetical protein VFX16_19410 [Pseudonocardiaceae bacterium]|nr:hypothetical protein [Pseudonocardiaceae bacterium]